MKRRLLIFLIGFFETYAGASQDFDFKVLAYKGTNTVKTQDGIIQSIKTGASLKSGDELNITNNAYLGLVHNTGRTLELKLAGSYKIVDLIKEMPERKGVLTKYANFILSNASEAKKNRLSATAAVHRSKILDKYITVFLPEPQFSTVFDSEAVIRWDTSKVSGLFVVTVTNLFDDVLQIVETSEPYYKINLNAPEFEHQPTILVMLQSKLNLEYRSTPHTIKRLLPKDRRRIKKEIKNLCRDIPNHSPLGKLILAKFYEENALLIDAMACYEEAISLAPDVDSYKDSYEEFLVLNKIK